MRPPHFWSAQTDSKSRDAAPLTQLALTPFAWLYATITARRIRLTAPQRVNAGVICVGNLTVGGTGKSPIVAALRARLTQISGRRVASLSRGYGGRLKGPCRVDPTQHSAADVGDEPLMLAQSGESWIGADRAAAGYAMAADGVDLIIMDDGHQNPGLFKDISIVVVDTDAGFGNGHIVPKGPLREAARTGLARADMVVQLGSGDPPQAVQEAGRPILHAQIQTRGKVGKGRFVGFAGIGRPEKFFDTLGQTGMDICDTVPFPDHHVYSDRDMAYLRRLAQDHNAALITTDKDFVRLRQEHREGIRTLGIDVTFSDTAELDRLMKPVLNRLA